MIIDVNNNKDDDDNNVRLTTWENLLDSISHVGPLTTNPIQVMIVMIVIIISLYKVINILTL